MQIVGAALGLLLWAYLGVLTVRAVLSWMPVLIRGWRPVGVLQVISEIANTLTDPPVRFLGRFLPALRLGQVHLSLAFLVLYVAVLWLARTLW
jgi:YggT family protein